jgi:hypothetical protein
MVYYTTFSVLLCAALYCAVFSDVSLKKGGRKSAYEVLVKSALCKPRVPPTKPAKPLKGVSVCMCVFHESLRKGADCV